MKQALLIVVGVVTVLGISFGNSQAQQNCDSSYPTVCIPSPPPDLDCAEVDYTNFVVRSPDPHRFDGDKDGIGCEQ